MQLSKALVLTAAGHLQRPSAGALPASGILAVAAFVMLAAGCAGAPPNSNPVPEVPEPEVPADSVVQVLPLTRPEAVLLVTQAREAEAQGRLEEATALLAGALEITPDDPGIWQLLAELALKKGRYDAALDHAQHAFELGPRIGTLCHRNWQTMQFAHDRLGRLEEAEKAQRRAQLCHVRPGSRY